MITTLQQTELGLNLRNKRTRNHGFLAQMEALIALQAPGSRRGGPPFIVHIKLRIHFLQQWLALSDLATEEARHDVPLFREFATLNYEARLPDESTIVRFRPCSRRRSWQRRFCGRLTSYYRAIGCCSRWAP